MSAPTPTNEPSAAPESASVASTKTRRDRLITPLMTGVRWLSGVQKQWLLWLVIVSTSTVTGTVAFQWLAGLPPSPDCKNILASATRSQSEDLYCANETARKGDEKSLSDALKLAGSISENDPLFEQAHQLANSWSKGILVLARQKVDKGELEAGIELAKKVPETSSVHAEAQQTIKDWETNWKNGEAIFKKANEAIQDQDWATATTQVRDLVKLSSDYWQQRADEIVEKISVEQQEFYRIGKIHDQIRWNDPDDIAAAIQEVSQISPKRLARKRALQKVDEWSQRLVEYAAEAYEYGDYDDVIKTAQKVPPSSKMAAAANAYLQLGRAEKAVKENESLWSYMQAVALTQQTSRNTTVRKTLRPRQQEWERQVQNWGQIALAEWIAHFDQPGSYQLAIAQAGLVSPEEPKRIEAQTRIAQWTNQADAYSERQFLARARQLSLSNTKSGFQRAIAEARKVSLGGRFLQSRAASLIADWQGGVERIQDLPILEKARALAKAGDYDGAIKTAEQITRERSLYDTAQDEIWDWIAQVQNAEDRPILSEAESLARQGRLTAAINRASDIAYGRSLYWDAQSRISDWAEERRQIEASRQPVYEAPSYSESPASEDEANDQDQGYSDSGYRDDASYDPYNNASPTDAEPQSEASEVYEASENDPVSEEASEE